MPTTHLAVDIGGSSMKMTLASLIDGKIVSIEEKTVPNPPLYVQNHLCINLYGLYQTILDTLRTFKNQGREPTSFGIDTYGNGYGILNHDGELIGLPIFYKDLRTKGILTKMEKILALRELYSQSGVFPTEIRVLMQLFHEVRESSERINSGKQVLLFPDLLSYFFTGKILSERSMASVANLLNYEGNWANDIFEKLGIAKSLFPQLIDGGENGSRPLLPALREILGTDKIQYVDVISHDTESALLAAPEIGEDTVFASLGTSVVFGTRSKAPIISDDSYNDRFKNMRGAFAQNSICRDYNGLWILERCIEEWRKDNPNLGYDDIIIACQKSKPNESYVDVNDDSIRFFSGSMPEAIRRYCSKTNQPIPEGISEIALCVLESIALEAKWSYEALKKITRRQQFRAISAIGGGIRNSLLLQMFADALELPLYAGSPFAATNGNILMQLYALGKLSKEGLFDVARNSCEIKTIYPKESKNKWNEALIRLERYRKIYKF